MADIIIRGKEYDNANSVTIPKTDETGNAVFYDTSDANATTSDILTGKSAYTSRGKINGAIPINMTSGVTEITDKAQTVTFNAGFYPSNHSAAIGDSAKNYIVSENIKAGISILGVQGNYTNISGSEVAATASDIVEGKTAYINGEKLTGVMVNNGSISGSISTKNGTVTIPAGYTSGGSVGIDSAEIAKITSNNILAGISILGETGDSNNVNTASATATAGDIYIGKTAYVKGNLITGTNPGGGSGNDAKIISGIWTGYTGSYSNSDVTRIKFGLADDTYLPNCVSIGEYVFYNHAACKNFFCDNLETIEQFAFFTNNNLQKIDAGKLSYIGRSAFRLAPNFNTLIIRNTEEVCTLYDTAALASSGIGQGSGYIYVPDSLYNDYLFASNWSTFQNQLKRLSELP